MAAMILSKAEARKFLLVYHGLSGDFAFAGKEGIMAYIRRVGCIQYDPLNVAGTNPELVLQSRIRDFRRGMLPELLYEDRRLIDYWDKNMSIFPLEDWPYFRRYRNSFQPWCDANSEAVSRVRAEIESRGMVCSGDLEYDEKVNWAWGPTRLSRAALEGMYHAGHLSIHHKTNTRKYYDLTERLIPQALIATPDPFESDEQYNDWYVLRRIGSIGLLWNRPSDAWLGIGGLKSLRRNAAFARLADAGKITAIDVEGLLHPLYIRSEDLDILSETLAFDGAEARTSLLAPLDNLLWDRILVQALFDFEYRWEVYKPAAERKYGYYVLPVLHGDRIVARFEPAKYRKNEPLIILNWWWENNAAVTESVKMSIAECFERFAAFLGAAFRRENLERLMDGKSVGE